MKTSDQIIEVLDYLGEKLGVSIDWTSENILPYIQTLCGKYINWEIATSIVWLIVGIVFIILSVICFKYFIKYAKQYEQYKEDRDKYEKYYDSNDYAGSFLIVFFCLLVIGICVSGCQIFDIIKCIYLPELQIYEYINTLISE